MDLKELEDKYNAACEKCEKYVKTLERNRKKVADIEAKASADAGLLMSLKFSKDDLRKSQVKYDALCCSRDEWREMIAREKNRIAEYAVSVPVVMKDFCENIVKAWDKWDMQARDCARIALEKWYAIEKRMVELRNGGETASEEYKALDKETFALRLHNGGFNARRGYMRMWEWSSQMRVAANRRDEDIHNGNVTVAENFVRDLYMKVAAVTGTVVSWKGLHLAQDGRGLDGIVTGKDGKCKVQTVGAGGYNIQRFHYRCLTRALKD